MLSHVAWGWIFVINAPVSALALLGVWRFVPESSDPANPRLDWPSAVLSAVGITGVIYAIIEEPTCGWNAAVLGSLVAGAVMSRPPASGPAASAADAPSAHKPMARARRSGDG